MRKWLFILLFLILPVLSYASMINEWWLWEEETDITQASRAEIIIKDPAFGTLKKTPVKFSHKKHADPEGYNIACTDCHHDYVKGENVWTKDKPVKKCSACHRVNAAEKNSLSYCKRAYPKGKVPGLKCAYHMNCIGCHRALKIKYPIGKYAVPITCTKCHRVKRVDPFQYWGARVEGLTPYLAQKLGVKKTRGVVITYVAPESPADKLRLRKGDMIVEINGRSTEDLNDYQEAITDTLSSFAIKKRGGPVEQFLLEKPW